MPQKEITVREKASQFLNTDLILMCNNPSDETPSDFIRLKTMVVKPEEVLELEWPYRLKPIVCWGDTSVQDLDITWYGKKYNNVPKRNKYTQAIRLMAANVPVVPAALSPAEAYRLHPSSAVIRRTLAHSQGRGLTILKDPNNNYSNEQDSNYYYRPYISFMNEYRVHIINNTAIIASHKEHDGEGFNSEESSIIRSYDNGWRFVGLDPDFLRTWKIWKTVVDNSIKALEVLGYDFGAVDIGVTTLSKDPNVKVYILEVNSAPGLIPEHVELYKKMFVSF
jgi:hypothetical protein